MKSLIIVDVQDDFCPGGALPVPEGDRVVEVTGRNQLGKALMQVREEMRRHSLKDESQS